MGVAGILNKTSPCTAPEHKSQEIKSLKLDPPRLAAGCTIKFLAGEKNCDLDQISAFSGSEKVTDASFDREIAPRGRKRRWRSGTAMASTAQDSSAPLRGPEKKDEDRDEDGESTPQIAGSRGLRTRLCGCDSPSWERAVQPVKSMPSTLWLDLCRRGGSASHDTRTDVPSCRQQFADGAPAVLWAVEYSPFYGIEKGAVLQEARMFNDRNIDARRCQQVGGRTDPPACTQPSRLCGGHIAGHVRCSSFECGGRNRLLSSAGDRSSRSSCISSARERPSARCNAPCRPLLSDLCCVSRPLLSPCPSISDFAH